MDNETKLTQSNDMMSASNHAAMAWDIGLDSTANPYPIDTVCWGEWAREFMRLNDVWMAKAAEK